MNDNETLVYDKIKNSLAKQFSIQADKISLNSNFDHDLGLDFVAVARFIVEIEDEYGDIVPDDQAKDVQTVGELVSIITTNTTNKKKAKARLLKAQIAKKKAQNLKK